WGKRTRGRGGGAIHSRTAAVVFVAGRASGLGRLRLPVVEQPADVLEAEVEVGQLVAQLQGPLQVARLGAAAGDAEEQLLAGRLLVGRQVLQRLLAVALRQLPVVAPLEPAAQVVQ